MHFNLADLFESVADVVPERTALVCGAERRTFAQLDRRAAVAEAQCGLVVGCFHFDFLSD